MTRILLLSGMSPDDRVYRRLLPLLPNAELVSWIRPNQRESITDYCGRLANTIKCNEPTIVCGVSFGGIIASELAPLLNAKCCVQISSIASPNELPPTYRVARFFRAAVSDTTLRLAGSFSSSTNSSPNSIKLAIEQICWQIRGMVSLGCASCPILATIFSMPTSTDVQNSWR